MAQRPADLAARYGGEELAALLPGTDARGAGEVAEDIRAAIEALGSEHGDSPPAGVVTMSVGMATVLPVPGDDPAEGVRLLLAAADGALYEAKRMGRNRVLAAPGREGTFPGNVRRVGAGRGERVLRSA